MANKGGRDAADRLIRQKSNLSPRLTGWRFVSFITSQCLPRSRLSSILSSVPRHSGAPANLRHSPLPFKAPRSAEAPVFKCPVPQSQVAALAPPPRHSSSQTEKPDDRDTAHHRRLLLYPKRPVGRPSTWTVSGTLLPERSNSRPSRLIATPEEDPLYLSCLPPRHPRTIVPQKRRKGAL